MLGFYFQLRIFKIQLEIKADFVLSILLISSNVQLVPKFDWSKLDFMRTQMTNVAKVASKK